MSAHLRTEQWGRPCHYSADLCLSSHPVHKDDTIETAKAIVMCEGLDDTVPNIGCHCCLGGVSKLSTKLILLVYFSCFGIENTHNRKTHPPPPPKPSCCNQPRVFRSNIGPAKFLFFQCQACPGVCWGRLFYEQGERFLIKN